MTAAVFAPARAGAARTSSRLSGFARSFLAALTASRAKRAAIELRRHQALIRDFKRREDHSARSLEQSEPLPFTI